MEVNSIITNKFTCQMGTGNLKILCVYVSETYYVSMSHYGTWSLTLQ